MLNTEAMIVHSGKLILQSDYNSSLLYYPKSDDDRKNIGGFSWAGEDYRPRSVAAGIEGAVSKPDEYMPFYFRHLTATIVGAFSWKATEFTEEVLKAAASKLKHKPAYVNHQMETSNIVGVNGEISYVGKSKAEDGTPIPGGLEGPIWVDAMLHKDLCRQLTGYPVPHIQSVSVTVTYKWTPSHEFTNRDGQQDDWEFERQIGQMVDGKMVRRIVTEIIDFYETSFVFLGADPYAKILDDKGKPLNIEKDAIVDAKSFDKDPLVDYYKSEQLLFIRENSIGEQKVIHLKKAVESSYSKTGKLNFGKPTETKNNTDKMEKLLERLSLKLGKGVSEITTDMIDNMMVIGATELAAYKTAESNFNAEKVAKEKAEASLVTAKESLSKYEVICPPDEIESFSKEVDLSQVRPMAKFASEIMAAKKAECVKFYNLSVGAGNESQAVIDAINKADTATLEGFMAQYGKTVHESFTGKCSKCGSDEISFRSTKAEAEAGDTSAPRIRLSESLREE